MFVLAFRDHSAAALHWVVGGAAGVLLGACGTHADDEIPAELLAAIEGQTSNGSEYPAGPYGSQVGDTAPNFCVSGWKDPKAADYDPERLEPICLSDYWDPEHSRHHLLLVNSAAIWCGACRTEYKGQGSRPPLGEELRSRKARGLVALGTLFQDASRNPATEQDASNWVQTFSVDFPFALDASFALGAFADPLVQPFNMVIATDTMQIQLRLQGDEPDTIWPAIDALLEEAKQ